MLVRAATKDDIPAITALDTMYTAGRRELVLARDGAGPEHTFSFRWCDGTPREERYAEYDGDRLRGAFAMTDTILVAEDKETIVGMLMIVVPPWTDAGEITDLAVDRGARRRGAGRALVDSAIAWAQERSLRALWVEPRGDNSDAVEFYVKLGFRLSGFNDRMYSNTDDAPGRTTLLMYLELN